MVAGQAGSSTERPNIPRTHAIVNASDNQAAPQSSRDGSPVLEYRSETLEPREESECDDGDHNNDVRRADRNIHDGQKK